MQAVNVNFKIFKFPNSITEIKAKEILLIPLQLLLSVPKKSLLKTISITSFSYRHLCCTIPQFKLPYLNRKKTKAKLTLALYDILPSSKNNERQCSKKFITIHIIGYTILESTKRNGKVRAGMGDHLKKLPSGGGKTIFHLPEARHTLNHYIYFFSKKQFYIHMLCSAMLSSSYQTKNFARKIRNFFTRTEYTKEIQIRVVGWKKGLLFHISFHFF